MQKLRGISILIMALVLIPGLNYSVQGADYNGQGDIRIKAGPFQEGRLPSFHVQGYYVGAERAETLVTIYLEDNTGERLYIANSSWTNDKWHRFRFPKISLGNDSERAFGLIADFQYSNGQTYQVTKRIHIKKPAVDYSAAFSSNGKRFFFHSQAPFTIQVIYSYGAAGQNETVYNDIQGKEMFEIPEYVGLTAVDIYVTDQWGHTNSQLPKTELDEPAPYHYFYFEQYSIYDRILQLGIFVFVLAVLVGLILLVRARWNRQEVPQDD